MLRKFNITVDGKKYVVEMEEIGGTPQPVAAAPAAAPVAQAAPAPAPAAAPTPAATSPVPAEGETMEAPMPGTILDIKVQVGDTVSFEQPLVILEAMKMENDLVAPKEGTVIAIHVNKGEAIDVGAPIITIG